MKNRRKSFLARKNHQENNITMDEMKSETTPDEFGVRTRYTLVEVQEHHKSKILETTDLLKMNLEKTKKIHTQRAGAVTC